MKTTSLLLLAFFGSVGVLSADITNTAPQVSTNAPPPAPSISGAPMNNSVSSNAAPVIADNSQGLVVTTPEAAKFDSAMLIYNQKQYAAAIPLLSQYISDFPNSNRREEALYRLGEAYRLLGRTDDALAAYAFQANAYPDGPFRNNGDIERGVLLFQANRFADAIDPLTHVATKGQGALQEAAKYMLGRSLLSTQKETEGRAQLVDVLNAQPPGQYAAAAGEALAELDDSEQHFPEALSSWQRVLALSTDPQIQASAAARGGWSALQAGKLDQAEALFRQARTLASPGDWRKLAVTGLLRILFQQKKYSNWLALYQSDAYLDTARMEVLYDLGVAHFALKQWPEAVTAFDAFLKDYATQPSAVTAAYERYLASAQISPDNIVPGAQTFLKAYPNSAYQIPVQLLEAQELSRRGQFADALPIWKTLANAPASSNLSPQQIQLELGRAYDAQAQWPEAAKAYEAWLANAPTDQPEQVLSVQARVAVCYQNAGQLIAAVEAWKQVEASAPEGSPLQQSALESLGLIYAKGGPPQEAEMVATFRLLLQKFPQSKLVPLAAYSVGDSLFRQQQYAEAEPFLLQARSADPKWQQPATQRLTLGAFAQKDYAKTLAYLKDYEAIPLPGDPQAQVTARLPAPLYYWLGETARQKGQFDVAETAYTKVTQHPNPGDLLAGAWWQLGQVQSTRQEWSAAVASYQKFRDLSPQSKDATTVILALGQAQLGAQDFANAKKSADQALLQEPEGPNSASARLLTGEIAFAQKNYPEAARDFATLAVLFDDPAITPHAMARAATAFDLAGDAKSAADWRAKLKEKYPNASADGN